jgi:hypothetical protein
MGSQTHGRWPSLPWEKMYLPLNTMKFYLSCDIKKIIPTTNNCAIPSINDVWEILDEEPEGTIVKGGKIISIDHMLDALPAMSDKFDLA